MPSTIALVATVTVDGRPILRPRDDHRGEMASTTGNGRRSHYISSNSIPITPLHRISYVQGGYASAVPLFLTHPRFARMIIPPRAVHRDPEDEGARRLGPGTDWLGGGGE